MNTFLDQSPPIISVTPPVTLDEGDGSDEVLSDVSETREGSVALAQHGDRLDRALTHLAPEFSRNYLQQLIDAGWVQLNGQTVRKHALKVRAADVLTLELHPTPQSQAFKPEPMDLVVVYEDPHIFVIDKPAGLVVHPAPGNWSGTLLNGLLALDEKMFAMPRAGIVHRLDKDTSGLMVVARTRQAMDALVAAIAARAVSRQYLAVGHGPWSGQPSVCVDAPMGRDPRNRLRMAVVELLKTPGKAAKTDIHFLANAFDGCLVRCVLHTGRTHQIRVHMASIGHPLVADKVYGGADRDGMARHALHAFRLAFDHPVTGAALAFESPMPVDFEHLLKSWGLSYNGPTR